VLKSGWAAARVRAGNEANRKKKRKQLRRNPPPRPHIDRLKLSRMVKKTANVATCCTGNRSNNNPEAIGITTSPEDSRPSLKSPPKPRLTGAASKAQPSATSPTVGKQAKSEGKLTSESINNQTAPAPSRLSADPNRLAIREAISSILDKKANRQDWRELFQFEHFKDLKEEKAFNIRGVMKRAHTWLVTEEEEKQLMEKMNAALGKLNNIYNAALEKRRLNHGLEATTPTARPAGSPPPRPKPQAGRNGTRRQIHRTNTRQNTSARRTPKLGAEKS